MKLSTIITSISVVAALTLGAAQFASAARQPEKDLKKQADKALKDATGGQPDTKAMEEMMMKMAEPGPEHKMLARMVGTWDCTAKFYEPDATGKVVENTSKAEAKVVSELGGRWFRQDFKGEFAGQPFSGIGFNGYDKAKSQYFGTWIDTMSTSMMIMTGTYDEAKKTLTMTGTFSMPGMDIKSRHTTEEKDANTVVFTMYHDMGGQEMKAAEITYKRRG